MDFRGINQEVSTYDLFVFWHVVAMAIPLPPGNAAHSGPIFLPWHRIYLLRLEQNLQRVLDDPDFGLPYWDWADDGELDPNEQWRTDLWTADYIGEARGSVRSGEIGKIRVRLFQDPFTGGLLSIDPRPVRRTSGQNPSVSDLPRKAHVRQAMEEPLYDREPWNFRAIGHRNRLEGWLRGPQLHNRVHVWIGGDMSPGTSPNDPAFFLNHCNVDRIWEAWMGDHGQVYEPGASEGPAGHRIDSAMVALLGESMTPQQVINPSEWYSYDSLQP